MDENINEIKKSISKKKKSGIYNSYKYKEHICNKAMKHQLDPFWNTSTNPFSSTGEISTNRGDAVPIVGTGTG
jgi:hypothetical protein